MEVALVLFVALFAVVPLMLGAVVIVIVLVMSAKATPLPLDPEATVTFHARALRPQDANSLLATADPATFGWLSVTASEVVWRSEDGGTWATPIHAITVARTKGAFSFTGSGVDVEIDGSGPWRFVVSDRRINKVMRNTAKDFREADAARKLAGLLLARGARDASVEAA